MRKKLFINGEWIEGTHYVELRSPYNGEVLAEVPEGTVAEVHRAISAAEAARPVAANMPAHQRAEILERLCSLLEARKEEAAKMIALEAAKPIATARGEVERTLQTYKFAAEEAKRIYGETVPLDAAPGGVGRVGFTQRDPLGVIGAITPFNFPMNLVAHKVGPAIATGNTIVLKPANQTPLSALFIAELLEEAGLPAGVLNVVTGRGSVIGNQLVEDPRVKMITFTGSPEVGIAIRNRAGLKRVTLELGSNSAVIVDKGVDIEKIVPRCVNGAFSFQGQVCISVQRIYVHEEVFDTFVEQFTEATKKLRVGDPLDETTDVSALITGEDVSRVQVWIDEATQGGATVAVGGKSESGIIYPTVLLNAEAGMKVCCNEAFAPLVSIHKVSSVDEAIDKVNDSRYGLQAGVYTEDLRTAFRAAKALHVGGVIINDIPTFRVDNMPYGGVKESGFGREGIKYAVEEMTELKLVVFNNN